MQSPIIIGLIGKMGAGKSTFTKLLNQNCQDYPVGEVAFAAWIKYNIADALGISNVDPLSNEFKGLTFNGKTVGVMLQELATHYRNVLGQDIFVDILLRQMRDVYKQIFVVSDVRFPNEAERLKQMGAYLVRIEGPGMQLNDGRDSNHISETFINSIPVDQVIVNDKFDDNLLQLSESAKDVLAKLGLCAKK